MAYDICTKTNKKSYMSHSAGMNTQVIVIGCSDYRSRDIEAAFRVPHHRYVCTVNRPEY